MTASPAAPLAVPAAASGDAPAPSGQRSALALGLVGGLGEELLAALMAAAEYRAVHVGVTQTISSAMPKFRPWLVGHGAVVVDDAFVGITGEETFVPSASPMRRFGEPQVLQAAQLARDAGATTLVLVSPLPALLQMGEATRTLSSVDEVALVAMGFRRILFIRPTAADDTRRLPPILNLVRTVGHTLADLMLPSYTKALSARAAAQAILEGVRAAGPGVTVLGARELSAIVQAKLPALAPKRTRLR